MTMPTSRSALKFLARRMCAAIDEVVAARLAAPQQFSVSMPDPEDPDDTDGPIVTPKTEITLNVVERAKLMDVRDSINRILEECQGDKAP
jgi:hypothetical protein